MDADAYEAWYATTRGRWVAETEFSLLLRLLDLPPGASVLDVGCGTGQFTRRLAQSGYCVTGLDPDPERIAYARQHSVCAETYQTGDGTHLALADKSFDAVIAITSLCFVEDQIAFIREMLRVARKRIVIGLLNRHSLLHWQKHGRGGYRCAHWHGLDEARSLLKQSGVRDIRHGSAILLPSGSYLARAIEHLVPGRCALGGFLAVAGNPDHYA